MEAIQSGSSTFFRFPETGDYEKVSFGMVNTSILCMEGTIYFFIII